MTNFERIKQMTVEEIAVSLYRFKECMANCFIFENTLNKKHCYKICENVSTIKEWLESEVKEDKYINKHCEKFSGLSDKDENDILLEKALELLQMNAKLVQTNIEDLINTIIAKQLNPNFIKSKN